jgi:L-lactate dehydrogenase complex protein LldF
VQAEQFLLFKKKVQAAVKNKSQQDKIIANNSNYAAAFNDSVKQFAQIETAKQRAAVLKWKAVENLEKYLIEFEANFIKSGGKIIWAVDANEALQEITNILNKAKAKSVVKSKSMVAEEIGLNKVLQQMEIKPVETDLGQFIVQLAHEKPSHLVAPALHKSKEEIAVLFYEKFKLAPSSTPEEIVKFTRGYMREKFTAADIGITGANFIVADTGSISVTENEGNAMLGMSFPKIHIVVTGIEKIIPSLADLDLFMPLISTFGAGQQLTVYNNIVSGPRQPEELDGPEEMYVVLIDNDRSTVLSEPAQRQVLSCIKCSACLNVCPVYSNIGGHAYGTVYNGPIGSAITPLTKGHEAFGHLSEATTLCGRCSEVCPVKIDLHKVFLYNRKTAAKNKHASQAKKLYYLFWRKAMLKRKVMNLGGMKSKKYLFGEVYKSWIANKSTNGISAKSFNDQWKERMRGK